MQIGIIRAEKYEESVKYNASLKEKRDYQAMVQKWTHNMQRLSPNESIQTILPGKNKKIKNRGRRNERI